MKHLKGMNSRRGTFSIMNSDRLLPRVSVALVTLCITIVGDARDRHNLPELIIVIVAVVLAAVLEARSPRPAYLAG
jgi:hypothetical protein